MTSPGTLAVATRGLRKSYGSRLALDGLDLSVPSGVVYGFLGTIYYCGCRPFEVAGLGPDDIHLPEHGWGTLWVHGGIPQVANRWFDADEEIRTGPKGQSADHPGREVPIPPCWVSELRYVLQQCPPVGGVLFATRSGKPPTYSNINRAFKLAKEKTMQPRVPRKIGSRAMIVRARSRSGLVAETELQLHSSLDLAGIAGLVLDVTVPDFADAGAVFVLEHPLNAGEIGGTGGGDVVARRLGTRLGLVSQPVMREAFPVGEMTAFEDFVTEEVQKGRGIFGLYPATDEKTLTDFAAWRKAKGR